ncbi:MAG: hypothetical protein JRG76_10730 [Deltaproteobacteria bacterium]|nr:hypothetical protein [Deltaproteobacteria bacterium]MBW2414972.1 hypothetical protein [Deltaproteobacteria bacterium]
MPQHSSDSGGGIGQTALELRAEVWGHEPGRMRARVTLFTPAQRRARARRVLLLLLLGALLSAPIPGWHFVGVPGFIAGAVILSRRRRRQEVLVHSLGGTCPACGGEQEIERAGFESLPASVPCPGCGEFLKLEALR